MSKGRCFFTLYKFELLKILKNKVAIVTFFIFFVFAFIQGEFEITGNIEPSDLEKYKAIPKMFIHYHRLAFDGVEEPDLRITFDTDIRYRQINLSMKESKNDQEYNLNNKIIIYIEIMNFL